MNLQERMYSSRKENSMEMEGPLRNVTEENLDKMANQILREIDWNAASYMIYAKRWTNELKPILELKKYLQDRNKTNGLRSLNAKSANKGIGNKNRKTATEDTAEKIREAV